MGFGAWLCFLVVEFRWPIVELYTEKIRHFLFLVVWDPAIDSKETFWVHVTPAELTCSVSARRLPAITPYTYCVRCWRGLNILVCDWLFWTETANSGTTAAIPQRYCCALQLAVLLLCEILHTVVCSGKPYVRHRWHSPYQQTHHPGREKLDGRTPSPN